MLPDTAQLPPHSPESETATLASILLDPIVGADVCGQLFGSAGAAVFYDLRHQEIYSAITAVLDAGHVLDLITLAEELKKRGKLEQVGGLGYMAGLPDKVPSAVSLDYYAGIVFEKYKLRTLIAGLTRVANSANSPDAKSAELIGGVLSTVEGLSSPAGVTGAKDCANALIEHLEKIHHLDGRLSGIATGFYDLDRMTSGLQYAELAILAARPSGGKTALAGNIVHRACLLDNTPTLFISLEMSKEAVMRRMLSHAEWIEMSALKEGRFTEGDFRKFQKFHGTLSNAPLYFYDTPGTSIDTITAIIRHYARAKGVKLVVIDYLQLINARRQQEKRTYEVGEVSKSLKAAARRSGCAILALAQLNRESEKDKGRRPRISDLADSSQIERDADAGILLHRCRNEDGTQSDDAEIIVAKQRDGATGIIALKFEARYCSFQPVKFHNQED